MERTEFCKKVESIVRKYLLQKKQSSREFSKSFGMSQSWVGVTMKERNHYRIVIKCWKRIPDLEPYLTEALKMHPKKSRDIDTQPMEACHATPMVEAKAWLYPQPLIDPAYNPNAGTNWRLFFEVRS